MSARSAHDSLGSNHIGNANKFDGSNCSVNNEERNKQQTQPATGEEEVEIEILKGQTRQRQSQLHYRQARSGSCRNGNGCRFAHNNEAVQQEETNAEPRGG